VAHVLVPLVQVAHGEVQNEQLPLLRVYPVAQLEQKLLLEQLMQLFTVQVTQLVTPLMVVRMVLLAQVVHVLLGWQLLQLAILQETQLRPSVLGDKELEHDVH
jgi:hypothetical protein